MKNKDISGIYIIYNKFNSKMYIGSSIHVHRRLKEHINNLKNNKHANIHLQHAYNKYKDFIDFELLDECPIESLAYMEQYWFNITGCTNRKYGYNIDLSAFNSGGRKTSEETRLKISTRNKGKRLPKEVVEKIRLSNLGQKRPEQSIKMRLRYEQGNPNKLGLKYLSQDKLEEVKIKLSISTKRRYENEDNLPKTRQKLKMLKEGEIFYFKSLRDAARNLNVDKGGIKYALKYNNGYFKKLNAYFELV